MHTERRGNREEAVGAIKQAHELRSTSPAITDYLLFGWAYFITGEHIALSLSESAFEGQPEGSHRHPASRRCSIDWPAYEARYAWKSVKLFCIV
jgi:hypothetical protein